MWLNPGNVYHVRESATVWSPHLSHLHAVSTPTAHCGPVDGVRADRSARQSGRYPDRSRALNHPSWTLGTAVALLDQYPWQRLSPLMFSQSFRSKLGLRYESDLKRIKPPFRTLIGGATSVRAEMIRFEPEASFSAPGRGAARSQEGRLKIEPGIIESSDLPLGAAPRASRRA